MCVAHAHMVTTFTMEGWMKQLPITPLNSILINQQAVIHPWTIKNNNRKLCPIDII